MSSWGHVGEDVCHRDRLDPRPRRFGSLRPVDFLKLIFFSSCNILFYFILLYFILCGVMAATVRNCSVSGC